MTPLPLSPDLARAMHSTAFRLALIVLLGSSVSSLARAAGEPVVTTITVERIRPKKEHHPTLRFLKENRDFIRARFDLLREESETVRGEAGGVDPRFLAYARMLAEVRATQDSLAIADDAGKRRELFENVGDLSRLESGLDAMDRMLADQQKRLGVLQQDFAGHQQTALSVLLSGVPDGAVVSEAALVFDDGSTVRVPLSEAQRLSLKGGGILELFHGLVEPRSQVLQLGLSGAGWSSSDSGFVTLDPARDRLTFLRLDLSSAKGNEGSSSVTASTWLLEDRPPVVGRTEP